MHRGFMHKYFVTGLLCWTAGCASAPTPAPARTVLANGDAKQAAAGWPEVQRRPVTATTPDGSESAADPEENTKPMSTQVASGPLDVLQASGQCRFEGGTRDDMGHMDTELSTLHSQTRAYC